MLKTFALALSLSAALTVAGCTATSNGTAGYGGSNASSVADVKKSTAAARRSVRKAKREAAKLAKQVAIFEKRIVRDKKYLRGKVSAKRRKDLVARLKRSRTGLRKAQRALRAERRDQRLAQRTIDRAQRAVKRAQLAEARAKRNAEARKARLEAREARIAARRAGVVREGTAGRRTASWLGGARSLLGGRDPAFAFAADYRARNDGGWALPAIPIETMPKRLLRQKVRYRTRHKPGTIVVDTGARFLYFVESDGMAMRYGIGVGRAGFDWSGEAHIGWKQKWPKWTPPEEMIERQPELAKYCADCGGMPGGISNPLGARALYLHEGGRDTLFRLHGTPDWRSIGTAASSGCIRMINQDVIDLYDRARTGAKVVVM